MGKLLMLREADDERIERLRARLGIPRKVDVVRAAMDLLELAERIEQSIKQLRGRTGAGADEERVSRTNL